MGDTSIASNNTAAGDISCAPKFTTRSLTKEAAPKASLSKSANIEESDDFDQLQDMLSQWSTPQMETYLGEEIDEELRTYHARKTKQQDEEVTKLESKLSNLWSERRGRMQKHLKVIKDKEEAERRRIEEERQRLIREEQERQRKIEEEKRRIQLEKEKAEAEIRRIAAEKAEKERLAAEAKRKAEEEAAEKARKEEEARKIEEAAKAEEKKKNSAATAYTNWDEIDKEFQAHKQTIADIKANILAPVTARKELKTVCFQAKRKVKPKLGQLTDSNMQLMKLYNELAIIVEECKNTNELVFQWILNFFCKSVVAQAETETTVSIQSALPLGKLAVMMMLRFEPLRDMLLARFVKKCPYVIGYSCAIDTEEGRLRMGWKRRNDKWEESASYSERIAGICAVWAVMTVSQVDTHGQPHPYPLAHSWRFLARMANTNVQLLENSHYAAVAIWWDIASQVFAKAYGKQGTKLLAVITGPWTQQVLDKRYPAALRLGLLGEDWQTSNQLKSLKPMEA